MIHMPFEDRISAGRCLAQKLTRAGVPPDTIVIALAPGGVPVGCEVADRLHLDFDVVAARRIAVPWQREITIGAVVGTETILDDELISTMGISSCELGGIVPDEIEIAARDNDLYHRHAPAVNVCGRPVVIVDDGLQTGDTMLAAVRNIRLAHPSLVIAAAPVGPASAFARLKNEADRIVSVGCPECFCTIGEHFQQFDEVTVDEIEKLLRASRRQRLRMQAMTLSVVAAALPPAQTGPNTAA